MNSQFSSMPESISRYMLSSDIKYSCGVNWVAAIMADRIGLCIIKPRLGQLIKLMQLLRLPAQLNANLFAQKQSPSPSRELRIKPRIQQIKFDRVCWAREGRNNTTFCLFPFAARLARELNLHKNL